MFACAGRLRGMGMTPRATSSNETFMGASNSGTMAYALTYRTDRFAVESQTSSAAESSQNSPWSRGHP